jgi:hypothetical protein
MTEPAFLTLEQVTEHPNALPASWHLSLVNPRGARSLFHQRCTRAELK